MGQQQLLLIVLGTVIVGLAILAGITAYSQNNIKSDLDAVTQDCLRLASDAQSYAQKPQQFGGGVAAGDTDGWDFSGISADAAGLAKLGWTTASTYSNIAVTAAGAQTGVTFTCTSIKFPANNTRVVLTGILPTNIATTVTKGQ